MSRQEATSNLFEHDIITDTQCHLQEHLNTSASSQYVAACDKSITSTNSIVTLQLHSRSENSLKPEFTQCFTTKENVWSPPPPERQDSLEPIILEEEGLKEAAWFQAGIPREIVQELLANEPVGSFMVRKSTRYRCSEIIKRYKSQWHNISKIGDVIALQTPEIHNKLISSNDLIHKVKDMGFTKEFTTLSALITHHSVMPELLPCLLSLSRRNAIWSRLRYSEELVNIDQDPSVNLTDLRRTLANLHI
ncbi:tensin-3-like [Limulus polyphemus]|uniref:Tensin-3-like n=1 Tax=Limulus polyphemus TaxID=6850 RepID=A0ABM1BDF8_LIMPO|nr:tensin-3-like [Limulus polyphemus]